MITHRLDAIRTKRAADALKAELRDAERDRSNPQYVPPPSVFRYEAL